jgi:hydrogenase maturation protease
MLPVMLTSEDTVLVLGLGNILLSDEAVGVRVVEYLQGLSPVDELKTKLMDGGTMGLTLLVEMENADAMVIIDAALLDQEPGAIRVFEGEAMDHFLRHRGRSPHDIGLDDILDGLRLREAVPYHRALVGIQPAKLTVGEDLSPAVERAIPEAAGRVLDLLHNWKFK